MLIGLITPLVLSLAAGQIKRSLQNCRIAHPLVLLWIHIFCWSDVQLRNSINPVATYSPCIAFPPPHQSCRPPRQQATPFAPCRDCRILYYNAFIAITVGLLHCPNTSRPWLQIGAWLRHLWLGAALENFEINKFHRNTFLMSWML